MPLMAAGGPAGVITVWNLEARRMHTLIKDAHDSSLVALHFFAGEASTRGRGRVDGWVACAGGCTPWLRLLPARAWAFCSTHSPSAPSF